MKITKKRLDYLATGLVILICTLNFSCTKEWLDEKPDKKLLVPNTLEDFQSLLDNNAIMNNAVSLPQIGSDDLYITDAGWLALSTEERNAYIWKSDIFEGGESSDWNFQYQQVLYANVVLDGLQRLRPAVNPPVYNAVKGSALFYRALAFYHLTQEFARPFDPITAGQDKGVPLKLNSNVNQKAEMGTVKQAYDQIISDLRMAEELLPLQQQYKTRPSKKAVQALLARIFLVMGDYRQAAGYADRAIQGNPQLLDYNTLNAAASKPFPADYPVGAGNPEVLYYAIFPRLAFFSQTAQTIRINEQLYQSYGAGDLRKRILFNDRGNGVVNFRGSYSGSGLTTQFSGLAIDEVYLIRAECFARLGELTEALLSLNELAKNRYDKSSFQPFTETDQKALLRLILTERRKELMMRGTRWTDLRRLNKEPDLTLTLRRTVDGQEYILSPGDLRFTLPIPDVEVK